MGTATWCHNASRTWFNVNKKAEILEGKSKVTVDDSELQQTSKKARLHLKVLPPKPGPKVGKQSLQDLGPPDMEQAPSSEQDPNLAELDGRSRMFSLGAYGRLLSTEENYEDQIEPIMTRFCRSSLQTFVK